MHKTLMLALVLFSAVWLQAQEAPKSDASKMSGPTTLQGCLTYAHGKFSLTDSSGTKHPLRGKVDNLKPHVGHEIEVTGMPSTRTKSTTVQGSASSATVISVFQVESFKHVADTCTAK